jgi:hypothetical protein
MPDNASVTPATDSAVIHETSLCVYQAILGLQHQQPELLREKYRNVPWRDARNQAVFMMKLKEGLSKTQDKEALILKVQNFLKVLLITSYFELPISGNLIERICSYPIQIKIAFANWGKQVLEKMIKASTAQSPGSYIPITTLGTQFQLQYGQSVTTLIKKLQLNDNLIKFLHSCSAFELKQTDKVWRVAVREAPGKDIIAQS